MVHFSAARLVTVVSLAPVVFAALPPDCVSGPLASNKICDATAEPEERAAALVAAMTTDEKLRNLVRYVVKCWVILQTKTFLQQIAWCAASWPSSMYVLRNCI